MARSSSFAHRLAAEVAKALEDRQAPRHRPSFLWLAGAWLHSEGRRLACPDNERRHLRHMRALWGLREGELTAKRIATELAKLLKQNGGKLGPATVNKLRSTGKRIVRFAQLDEAWHGGNPFQAVRRMREPEPILYVPTVEELRRVLPRLREDRRREALFLVTLGPRPGEEKALRREDLDMRRRTVTFRRSNDRPCTKTGRVRVVPVPRALWRVLLEALDDNPGSELVFPSLFGWQQRADTKLSRTLREAYRRARIVTAYRYTCRRKGCGFREVVPDYANRRCPRCDMKLWRWGLAPPVTWYALRHASATLHRLAGCDPLVIQRCLGHAERVATDRIYTRSLPLEYMRAQLSKLRL